VIRLGKDLQVKSQFQGRSDLVGKAEAACGQNSPKVIDDRFLCCHNERQVCSQKNAVVASRCVLASAYLKGFYHFPMSLSPGRFDQKVRRFRFSH
jgi:hypothetical protein